MKMVSWMWKGSAKEGQEVDEEELKKKGFNPEGLEVEEVGEEPYTDFDKDYEGFIDPEPADAMDIINNIKFYPNEDEHRHELAYSKGGKICGDKKMVTKIRSIGKEMIKLIGKKIISGDLNLTRISFPIRVMVPKTALQNSTLSCCTMPYYLKKATQSPDPIERMKYVITAIISAQYYMNLFLKPLNPVIGETLEGSYPDGTKLYCEQISHHPPISYFLIVGPQESYRYYGYYAFSAHAGLNSMTLVNKGNRFFEFKNGDQIQITFAKEVFTGSFLGTLRSEATGGLEFTDKKNSLKAEIKYGKAKKKPSDYFTGSIMKAGKAVSNFDGTYCGFLNFDDVRYWDGRFIQGFKIKLNELGNSLPSDFRRRVDLLKLRENKITEAQIEKEKIEEMQRKDAKLRDTQKK